MTKEEYSNWVPDKNYAHLMGLLRFKFNQIMYPLRLYGQGPICDQVVELQLELTEWAMKQIRGKDAPPPDIDVMEYNADD